MDKIKEVMIIIAILLVMAGSTDLFGAIDASNEPAISPAGAIRPVEKTKWTVNANDNDASGFEIIKASPGAGKNLYLELMIINCAVSDTVTIRDGTETTMLGPYKFTANGSRFLTLDFSPDALQLTASSSLSFATGAGDTK